MLSSSVSARPRASSVSPSPRCATGSSAGCYARLSAGRGGGSTAPTIITAHNHDWRQAVIARIEAIERQQNRLEKAKQHLEHLLTCPDENPAEECPYLREMTGF